MSEGGREDDGRDESELAALRNVDPTFVEQDTDQLREAVADSPVERRRALVVLEAQVGAATDQQAHRVDVVAAS